MGRAPGDLIADADGVTLRDTKATLVATLSRDGRPQVVRTMAAGPGLGLGYGRVTAEPPELEGSHWPRASWYTGDPAPFAHLDDPSSEYHHFVHLIDVTTVDLMEQAGASELAGLAMAAWGPADFDLRSERLQRAVAGMDPARLNPDQRRWWSDLSDRLDRTPDPPPFLGTATLLVAPEVRMLKVGGRLLVDRDEPGVAVETFEVPVPEGRAVLLQVFAAHIAHSACCGGFSWQTADGYGAWVGLIPGGRYEIERGAKVLPVGHPTVLPCVTTGVAPPGAVVRVSRSVTTTVTARVPTREYRPWHPWERVEIGGLEPGDYVADFPDEGAPRVRFTAGSCAVPPPPRPGG